MTTVREAATGIAELQCFAYDPLGQLKNAWTSKSGIACWNPVGLDGDPNVGPGVDGSGYWQQYEYDLVGNRTKMVEKDPSGEAGRDTVTTYGYGKPDGAQPHTLTKVSKQYTSVSGAAVTAETKRLYSLTGATTAVTSVATGEEQTLSWTWDGQVEKITGTGAGAAAGAVGGVGGSGGGRTAYVGAGEKCLDLKGGTAVEGTPVQLYDCNATLPQKFGFAPAAGQSDPNVGTLTVYDTTWCITPAAGGTGSATPSAAAVGAAVVAAKCTGAVGQQLKRVPGTGQLVHVATGLCVAVKDNATTAGTPVVLAVCDAGTGPAGVAQKWAAQDETRHIYGPSGQRLLTITGKQATLLLGEAEVTVMAGGTLVQSQRSYATPGGSVVRFANAAGGSKLRAVVTDHQGSPYAEVALELGNTYSVRKQDPFGNQRAASALGQNLATSKGFLGAHRDDASGFVPLGARLYDPVVGRFLSLDPVLDLGDPTQGNGYSYAHNNPVTHSDPSGLSISLTPSEVAAALAGVGLSAAQVAQAQAAMSVSLGSVILSAAWNVLAEFVGINDAIACFGGSLFGCVNTVLNFIPWSKLGKIPAVIKAVNRTINAIQAWMSAKKAAQAVMAAAKAAQATALAAKKAALERAKKAAQAAAAKKAADRVKAIAQRAVQQTKKTGNPVQKQAQAKANPAGASAAKSSGGGKTGSGKTGGTDGASSRSKGGTSGSGTSGKTSSGDSGSGSNPKCEHSFAPGTQVLMADGSRKAIEKVRVGDKVVSFDPATGKRSVRAVTVLHTNQDTDLTDITVKIEHRPGARTDASSSAGDGQAWPATQTARRVALALAPAAAAAVHVLAPAVPAHASDNGAGAQNAGVETTTAVVNTTANHPFWNLTTHTWTNATDLNPGDQLQPDTTNTGGTSSSTRDTGGTTTVTVTRIDNHTITRTMHDLTIDTIHTYHVLAGTTPVLVHNCEFGAGVADQKYDKHVLGLDDAGNATREPDMPEYDYDGGFEQYVEDARALMCSEACPLGARETVRDLNGVTTIIRVDATGRMGMRVGDKITTFFRPENWMNYFEKQANR